jgi:hypothetical protein
MSKSTSTAPAATTAPAEVALIAPDLLTRVVDAFSVTALDERNRVQAIVDLKAAGASSIRQMVAAVTFANGGTPVRGFSKSSIGRYDVAARAILAVGETGPKLTDAQRVSVAAAVVSLANYVGSADVLAAVDTAAKSRTGAAMVKAVEAEAKRAAAAEYAAAISTEKRGPQTRVAGAKSTADTSAPEPESAAPASHGKDAPQGKAATLGAAGLSDLLSEVARRVSVKGFTVAESDLAVFTAISAAVEEAVTAGRTVNV